MITLNQNDSLTFYSVTQNSCCSHVMHEGEVKPLDALRQLYLLATED